MKDFRDSKMATHKRAADGRMKFWGSTGLKSSQIYPPGYGKAIGDALITAPLEIFDDFDTSREGDWSEFREGHLPHWTDARLGAVWCFLGHPV